MVQGGCCRSRQCALLSVSQVGRKRVFSEKALVFLIGQNCVIWSLLTVRVIGKNVLGVNTVSTITGLDQLCVWDNESSVNKEQYGTTVVE